MMRALGARWWREVEALLKAVKMDPRYVFNGEERAAKLLVDLAAAKAPSRAVKAARAPRAAKHRARRMETSAIRAACLKRAGGACEHCGKAFTAYDPATLDHFEGGADKRAQESVEGCWMLRLGCHRAKSAETPSRMFWLEAFAVHCRRYDYPHERIKAQMARIWVGLAGGAA